ncbi:cytidine deaminase [Stomatohabitans albus]|uniref:cytidine deaminase n=1 Tax=Stomatohabitans albus TaxID=3110766 RepID=UPI00300C2FE9
MAAEQIDWAALDAAARAAQAHAYAPYSQFRVGAALLSLDGRIITGCNVENAAYPSTMCAEANAVGTATMEGARDIIACAVIGDTTDTVTAPCGNCRQVLNELNPNMAIHMMGKNGHEIFTTLGEGLLPYGFGGSVLPHH